MQDRTNTSIRTEHMADQCFQRRVAKNSESATYFRQKARVVGVHVCVQNLIHSSKDIEVYEYKQPCILLNNFANTDQPKILPLTSLSFDEVNGKLGSMVGALWQTIFYHSVSYFEVYVTQINHRASDNRSFPYTLQTFEYSEHKLHNTSTCGVWLGGVPSHSWWREPFAIMKIKHRRFLSKPTQTQPRILKSLTGNQNRSAILLHKSYYNRHQSK